MLSIQLQALAPCPSGTSASAQALTASAPVRQRRCVSSSSFRHPYPSILRCTPSFACGPIRLSHSLSLASARPAPAQRPPFHPWQPH